MRSKPADLFGDGQDPSVSDTVELTVNDEFAKRLQVSVQGSSGPGWSRRSNQC